MNPGAKLLRHWRIRWDMSQETLAEHLGISPRTLRRWEAGEGVPESIGYTLIGLGHKLRGDNV